MTEAKKNEVTLSKRDYIALAGFAFTVFLSIGTGYTNLTSDLQTLSTGQTYQSARLDQLQDDVTRLENRIFNGVGDE